MGGSGTCSVCVWGVVGFCVNLSIVHGGAGQCDSKAGHEGGGGSIISFVLILPIC